MKNGFTLIEVVVTLAIISVLSGVILFGVNQYISKGKDSNIYANLATLVPAGEVFYTGNSNSYEGFCDPDINSVLANILLEIPPNPLGICDGNAAGLCCNVATPYNNAWAACAVKFSDPTYAFCVDSRGIKKEMPKNSCSEDITQCP